MDTWKCGDSHPLRVAVLRWACCRPPSWSFRTTTVGSRGRHSLPVPRTRDRVAGNGYRGVGAGHGGRHQVQAVELPCLRCLSLGRAAAGSIGTRSPTDVSRRDRDDGCDKGPLGSLWDHAGPEAPRPVPARTRANATAAGPRPVTNASDDGPMPRARQHDRGRVHNREERVPER